MVQYVFTPWRDRQELLLVRHQFYAPPPRNRSAGTGTGGQTSQRQPGDGPAGDESASSKAAQGQGSTSSSWETRQDQQHQAVARVSMWMQRGGCPHMVESTALLTAAVLGDEEGDRGARGAAAGTGLGPRDEAAAAAAAYAVRAAYSAAFSRFVTGLLDGHQDKLRKQSMYAIAKTIGLPATFVELRHQSTHEQLPSRAKLRSAARKALAWIWDYYWRHLGDVVDGRPADPCAEAVLRHLREEGEEPGRRPGDLSELVRRWGRWRLLETVAELKGSLPGNQVYLKCMELDGALREAEAGAVDERMDVEDVGKESPSATMEQEVDEQGLPAPIAAGTDPEPAPSLEPGRGRDTGWSRHEGPWKPKPIGVV